MICPLCAHRVPLSDASCSACGVDLREFSRVYYHPSCLFNSGLVKLERQQWTQAAQLFAEVCRHQPDDVDAHRAWAHAAMRAGRYEEALGALLDAIAVRDSPELQEQYAKTLSLCTLHDEGVARTWVELAAELRTAITDLHAVTVQMTDSSSAEEQ